MGRAAPVDVLARGEVIAVQIGARVVEGLQQRGQGDPSGHGATPQSRP